MATSRLLAAGSTVAATATAVAGAVAGEPGAYPAAAVLALLALVAWSRSFGSASGGVGRRAADGESERDGRHRTRTRPGRDGGTAPGPPDEMSEAEAYRHLGLDPGAGRREVRAAYLRRVKEVHPDRGGDETTFKRVREAYERLTG